MIKSIDFYLLISTVFLFCSCTDDVNISGHTDTTTETDTSTDTGTDADTEADTSTDTGTDADTETDTSTDTGTDADTETDASTDTSTIADTETDTGTDAGTDTGTDTGTDADTENNECIQLERSNNTSANSNDCAVFSIPDDMDGKTISFEIGENSDYPFSFHWENCDASGEKIANDWFTLSKIGPMDKNCPLIITLNGAGNQCTLHLY